MEPLKTPECKFPTNFPNFQIYKEIDFQSLYQKRDAEFKPNNSLQQRVLVRYIFFPFLLRNKQELS